MAGLTNQDGFNHFPSEAELTGLLVPDNEYTTVAAEATGYPFYKSHHSLTRDRDGNESRNELI